MEIVVISSPDSTPHEADTINALLSEGLPVFHVRKPDWSAVQMDAMVSKILPQFRSKITVHSHHAQADDWGLTRLHFPVALRSTIRPDVFVDIAAHKMISTSCHSLEEFQNLPGGFSYSFCGPVFSSISKPGYESEFLFNRDLIVSSQDKTRIFALGGIDETNISRIYALGFKGAAMLGAIWTSNEPLAKYRRIAETMKLITDNSSQS
jgi:thiamine-phosphate pyrophosphorylase